MSSLILQSYGAFNNFIFLIVRVIFTRNNIHFVVGSYLATLQFKDVQLLSLMQRVLLTC